MKSDLKTIVSVLLTALILISAGCITITLNKKGTKDINTKQNSYSHDVPVLYSSNLSAGSIQFEFVCADSEAQIISISTGLIGENAILKYNIYEPGRVLIGLVHSTGMKGYGELVKITLSASGDPRAINLSIENVVSYDLDRMQPMNFETAEGQIELSKDTIVPPSLKCLTD